MERFKRAPIGKVGAPIRIPIWIETFLSAVQSPLTNVITHVRRNPTVSIVAIYPILSLARYS
jgi:hypothetical protein